MLLTYKISDKFSCKKLFCKELFIFIIFILLFSFTRNCLAAINNSFWVNSQSYLQLRRNTINEKELPFLEYLAAGTSIGEYVEFDINLKVIGDPLVEVSDFDLYATRLQIKNIADMVSIKAGRQSIINNFHYDLIDGLNLIVEPDFYVGFEAYGGFVRFIELNEFRDYNFAAGAKLFLSKVSNSDLSVEFRYEKIEAGGDWVEIGFFGAQSFDVNFKPRIYAGLNADVSNQFINQLTAGASFRPHKLFDFGLNVARYDFKENILDPWEQIFSVFAFSAMWEFRQSAGLILTDNITLSQSYSHLRYNHDIDTSEPGHLFNLGLDITALKKRIRGFASAYYNHSYGGKAYGFNARAKVRIIKTLKAALRVGFLRFDKITGEADNASAIALDVGYEFFKGLEAIVGAEFNSNDDYERDFRGNLAVKFTFN